jgi:hypothetical protein
MEKLGTEQEQENPWYDYNIENNEIIVTLRLKKAIQLFVSIDNQ